jgi:hypothetical protein
MESFFQIISGAAMHTDEYEISIGREITLCRKFIKQMRDSLHTRERQHGMTTEELLQAVEQGRLGEQSDFGSWRKEYQDLQYWQKMLNEYEEALRKLKGI